MAESRSLTDWFALYGESHRNKTNKAIHFVAVPAIYLSVMGLLWAIPSPAFFASIPGCNWATLAAIPVLLFYRSLSMPLTFAMMAFTALCFFVLNLLDINGVNILYASIVLFAVMWVFQFIGHAVEGKKPSFFQDLQFLLIGPAWVLGFLMEKAGIRVS